MKTKYLRLIFPVLPVLMFSCGNRQEAATTAVRTAKIDTVRVTSGNRQETFPGRVRAGVEANLSFRVSGRIERLVGLEGSYVGKGTVVAELDARDYRVQLAAAEAEYKQVKATSERVIELYHRGSATKDAYDRAVAGIEQISAKLEHAKDQLADVQLTAPFDGYIRKHLHEVGETVGAGMGVVSMLGKGALQIEISLPVRDYAHRKDFLHVEATVATAPDRRLSLEPLESIPQGTSNQTYKMVFNVKNRSDVLLEAGMTAEVRITYRTPQPTVCLVPVSAVFEREGKSYVMRFVSETQPLAAQEVALGRIDRDGWVSVTSGLQGGECVVTSGIRSIREGMKVKPLPPVSRTNVGGMM